MKRIKLSPEVKLLLEKRHIACEYGKERDRIKAVLLRSEGWTVPMISQALRLHETTVTRHLNDYRAGKLTNNSGGSESSLNQEQTAELVSHLEETTYQITLEIIDYVKKTYGVIYSIPGINKWLHRHGFSYKKPKGYPHKACKTQQTEFIVKYNELKSNLDVDEAIMFMDSCHPSMSTKLSYGWIRTGKEKPLATTASRTRYNLVGALSLDDLSNPIVNSYSTVDGESIIDFLHTLRAESKVSGTINLILDQAGYHRSYDVIETATNLNIKLIYLPPYSPNLNPIERLWKVMNEHARNNVFFKTAEEFRQSIRDFFHKTLPKISSTLHLRINDNFQMLDYAF